MKKVKVSNAVGELILEGPEEVVMNVMMNYILGAISLYNSHTPDDCQIVAPSFTFFQGLTVENLNDFVQYSLNFDLMEITEVE